MFLGKYGERPYLGYSAQDVVDSGSPAATLMFSNRYFEAGFAAHQFDEYFEQDLFAEEMGIEGLFKAEHHNRPGTMGAFLTGELAALARLTTKIKIGTMGVIIGGSRADPVNVAEQLATIDVLSHGRLIAGLARGGGAEMVISGHNPLDNRRLWLETHEILQKTWTEPGPWRYEGQFYQYRAVNPFIRPLQQPSPPIWIPGNGTVETLKWAAQHHYPYIFLETNPQIQKERMKLYSEVARETGYTAGPQHFGYLIRTMVADTDEQARENARGFMDALIGKGRRPAPAEWGTPQGSYSALHEARIGGNRSGVAAGGFRGDAGTDQAQRPATSAPTAPPATPAGIVGIAGVKGMNEDEQLDDIIENKRYIVGNPTTVIRRFRELLQEIPVGTLLFWAHDGSVTHPAAMRNIELLGTEVMPALREIAREMDLPGPCVGANDFERDL